LYYEIVRKIEAYGFYLCFPFTCKMIEVSKEVKNILRLTNGTREAHDKSTRYFAYILNAGTTHSVFSPVYNSVLHA